MARFRAFVSAGLEDFAVSQQEAKVAGAPVMGLEWGVLLGTVCCAVAGLLEPTGVLFRDQSVGSLTQAVDWFE